MTRPPLKDMAQQNIIWHKRNIFAFVALLLLLFILLSVGLSVGLGQLVQKETTTDREDTTTTTTTASCPSGWIKKFGNCYQFFSEGRSWSDAEDHCKDNGVRSNHRNIKSYFLVPGSFGFYPYRRRKPIYIRQFS